jgi:hypothetical protein
MKKQLLLDLSVHQLIIDVSTRWNSTFDIVERYIEQQAAVYATLVEAEVKSHLKNLSTLYDKEVGNLETLVNILQRLKIATATLCSAQYPTVSLIHPMKERIIEQLATSADDNVMITAIKEDPSPRLLLVQIIFFKTKFNTLND